jgi:Glycosyl transferase family 2
MYTLAVGAAFKNEAHALEEWIEHYLARGVEHFYLIDDQSSDNFEEILEPYIAAGQVSLFKATWDRYLGRQKDMYNRYILPRLGETEWLLMVDLDEFMWSPRAIKLYDILKMCGAFGQIQVEHTLFGSNGHVTQPSVGLVKGFTRRSADLPSRNPGLRKYFVNSKFSFRSLNIHHATFTNKEDEEKHFVLLDKAWFQMNHYNCQSREFWVGTKCTRGDCDMYKVRDESYWNLYNLNDVEDFSLIEQNNKIESLAAVT